MGRAGNSAAVAASAATSAARPASPTIKADLRCQAIAFLRGRFTSPPIKPAMRLSAKLPFERISPPCIPQHQTGAAGAPDAIAEVIGLGARIGADPDLIKS